MLICTPGDLTKEFGPGFIGNIGTLIRYNISRNDRTRIFHLAGAAENTTVHDNAIYVGPGLDVQMLAVTNWEGWANGAVFRNNIFNVEGTARYGHELSRKDGIYTIAPGWGPAKGIIFEGNRYVGRHVDRPEDPKGIFGAAGAVTKLNWDGPQFDPAKPEGFENFVIEHREWMLRLFEQQFGKPVKLGR